MPNGLEPAVTKDELSKIQEAVRAVIYSLTMGHLAKAQNATPDLKFKVIGQAVGSSKMSIEIIRREDGIQG